MTLKKKIAFGLKGTKMIIVKQANIYKIITCVVIIHCWINVIGTSLGVIAFENYFQVRCFIFARFISTYELLANHGQLSSK